MTRLTAEDRLDIQQLISLYALYEDTGDAEAWAALFTADGGFTGSGGKNPVIGRDKLTAFARQRWDERPEVRNRLHWNGNIIIAPDPQGAVARSYQMTIEKIDGEYRVILVAGKQDELRRENGQWRFYRRATVPLRPE